MVGRWEEGVGKILVAINSTSILKLVQKMARPREWGNGRTNRRQEERNGRGIYRLAQH
jgi:hypothetical protein